MIGTVWYQRVMLQSEVLSKCAVGFEFAVLVFELN